MTSKHKRNLDDLVMSDLTILVSVEDLINIAMGPTEGNTINYKMIQTVLHILARQLRLLETKVDIKIADVGDIKKKKKREIHSPDSPSSETLPRREHVEETEEGKSPRGTRKKSKFKDKEEDTDAREKHEKKDKSSKEKDSDEKEERAEARERKLSKFPKQKQTKEDQDEEKAEAKERKSSKFSKLKQTREDQDESEGKQSPPKKAKTLKEKEQQVFEKMSPEENERYKKQKENEEIIMKNMSPTEKEKYLKVKEKELNILEQMSPKEKELYLKQKEREERALQKMSPKEKDKYFEEKEREQRALEGMSSKEREKYLKEKEEEAIALEKLSPKQKEKYLKEKQISKATGSGTSIAITEVERLNEKVLIVEKGPTTRASKIRVGSIEVVTISQFNMLEAEVERLKQTAGPLPMPALPDNKKLKADLVKGNASLTDTMQAMQANDLWVVGMPVVPRTLDPRLNKVSARVQAAEAGLARMAGLLTQLAASGALPEAFAGQLEDAKAEMEVLRSDLKGEALASSKANRKSVAIHPLSMKLAREDDGESGTGTGTGTAGSTGTGTRPSSAGMDKRASIAVSMGSRYSRASTVGRPIAVTRNEMDDAIQSLRDDMTKSMQAMTYRAASSAETAAGTAKGIADKMEIAINLNSRISDLYALTTDYAEQLSGFDAGLVTQMQSFQEQMIQMRGDLKSGLIQLETANNNAETAAVLELTERYNGLQNELERNIVEHQHLTVFQKQLGEELRGLVEAVEALKEQKADRDEVWDGLRDKADLTRLSGLLTEDDFDLSRAELNNRLEVCYSKFNRQETVWMTAMKDLTDVAMDKAEIMQLLSVKDEAQHQLRELQEKLRLLTIQLGEPKAAILTRLLSVDGTCGACKVPALMEAAEERAGKPHELPALRPPPDGQPCAPDFTPIVIEDEETKSHICNRWVGGSHTLVSRSVPREAAPAQIATLQPVKKYTGYGADGKLYNMEETLQPCIECNKLTTDEVKEETGAGDTEPKVCECWPGVEEAIQQGARRCSSWEA